MSNPAPEQRKLVNEYVIVFDTTRSTITTEKAEKYKDHIENPEKTLRIAPRLGNTVDITHNGRLVARLDLRVLGRVTNMKRALGKCNQIVVLS